MFYIVILIFFKLLVQSLPLSYVQKKKEKEKKNRKVHYWPCCLSWAASHLSWNRGGSRRRCCSGRVASKTEYLALLHTVSSCGSPPPCPHPRTLYSAGWRSRNLNCRFLNLRAFSMSAHSKFSLCIASPPHPPLSPASAWLNKIFQFTRGAAAVG